MPIIFQNFWHLYLELFFAEVALNVRYCPQFALLDKTMDGVNSNNISHLSGRGPSLDIKNIPCSHLLGSAPYLLMCYAQKFVECVMLQIHKCVCNKINKFELVNVHNYFIRIVHVINQNLLFLSM